MPTVLSVDVVQRRAWNNFAGRYRSITYQVIYDTQPTDIQDALTATGIPTLGALYTSGSTITAKQIGPAQEVDGNPAVIIVPVEFNDEFDFQEQDENPLIRPADINWGSVYYERAFEVDANGDAVLNSAGDPFDPPPTQPVVRLQCTIERNVATHNPTTAFAYINTVNNGNVTIAGVSVTAGQALMVDFSATSQREAGTVYARQRFVIEFAPSFVREILDAGYYQLTGGDKLPILDDNGDPFTEPQLLDGSGEVTTTPTFLAFDAHTATNFGTLALPTKFPDT
jgi:hypothetical protein